MYVSEHVLQINYNIDKTLLIDKHIKFETWTDAHQ